MARTLIEDLHEQVATRQVLVVVGAGVSIGACPGRETASWPGLLRDGVEWVVKSNLKPQSWSTTVLPLVESGDLEMMLSAAELITQALGGRSGGEYRRWLQDSVGSLTVRGPAPSNRSVLEALINLGARVATTNYDNLLEEVSGWTTVTWRQGTRVQEVLRGSEDAVVHMHGHFRDPKSVVLGIRSYEAVLGDAKAQALQRAIASFKSLILVGFGMGLADPNFGALREWMKATFPGSSFRHYRLCLDREVAAIRTEHGPGERIMAVPYGPSHDALAGFLRSLAPASPPSEVDRITTPVSVGLGNVVEAQQPLLQGPNSGLAPSPINQPLPGAAGEERDSFQKPPRIGHHDLQRTVILDDLGLSNRIDVEASTIGAEAVAGNIVLDASVCGFAGIDLRSVAVTHQGDLKDAGAHPPYIAASMHSIPKPWPNRPKVHLLNWHAPIIDQGDVLTLDVARSDYWTSEATRLVVPRIQDEVRAGRQEFANLPRRLDVHLVVVCAVDNKLLLTRRGSHVATEPSTWMITVGESMDWERDKTSGANFPHPLNTARFCLSERDELNLPSNLAEAAELRLVAIATEWAEMLVNLVVVARIPGLTESLAKSFFKRGENVELDAINFEVGTCVNTISRPTYTHSNGRGRNYPISDISKVALLAALSASDSSFSFKPRSSVQPPPARPLADNPSQST